jgi:hypothetical protein
MYRSFAAAFVLCVAFAACDADGGRDGGDPSYTASSTAAEERMNGIAESYVKAVLAVGEYDDGYVDAYYGPASWPDEVAAATPALDEVASRISALLDMVRTIDVGDADAVLQLRRDYLEKQLEAVGARIEMLQGRQFAFDDEAQALYDASPPRHDEAHFRIVLDSLEEILPGGEPLVERLDRYRADFVIPAERLDTVFQAAIAEARQRTREHIALPDDERFVLEYVTNQPWSGYNWYQGEATSLIQINTDLPIHIERAIDLAAHEGYPGHHVYNALLEQRLVRDRGWVEFSVYPLFSPQSLIAEGTANFGIRVAFPGDDRVAFARDVLFPLAGLDPARAAEYFRVLDLLDRLGYAGNEAARRYLDGEIDGEEAAEWLSTYALMAPERARQRVRFFDTYRSYVINYNLGQDLVREWIERQGGTEDDPARRWEVFGELLASPRLPSGLQ